MQPAMPETTACSCRRASGRAAGRGPGLGPAAPPAAAAWPNPGQGSAPETQRGPAGSGRAQGGRAHTEGGPRAEAPTPFSSSQDRCKERGGEHVQHSLGPNPSRRAGTPASGPSPPRPPVQAGHPPSSPRPRPPSGHTVGGSGSDQGCSTPACSFTRPALTRRPRRVRSSRGKSARPGPEQVKGPSRSRQDRGGRGGGRGGLWEGRVNEGAGAARARSARHGEPGRAAGGG